VSSFPHVYFMLTKKLKSKFKNSTYATRREFLSRTTQSENIQKSRSSLYDGSKFGPYDHRPRSLRPVAISDTRFAAA